MIIEWFLSFSPSERWLYGGIFTFISGLIILVLTNRLNHTLQLRRERHKNLIPAAKEFRTTIDTERLKNLRGRQLEAALCGTTAGTGEKFEGEFFKHKRAINEFRTYLGPINRFRLNRAWKKYHGGKEEYPSLFKRYCFPEDGPDLLIKHLKNLRKFGEIN
jgi:hypothetical protein